jgi:hypothetical protein
MDCTILIKLFPLFAFTWERRLRFKCSPTVILSEYGPEMSDSIRRWHLCSRAATSRRPPEKIRWSVSSWNHRWQIQQDCIKSS